VSLRGYRGGRGADIEFARDERGRDVSFETWSVSSEESRI